MCDHIDFEVCSWYVVFNTMVNSKTFLRLMLIFVRWTVTRWHLCWRQTVHRHSQHILSEKCISQTVFLSMHHRICWNKLNMFQGYWKFYYHFIIVHVFTFVANQILNFFYFLHSFDCELNKKVINFYFLIQRKPPSVWVLWFLGTVYWVYWSKSMQIRDGV